MHTSKQVRELAEKVSPDYPFREESTDAECLYAIESTCSGTVAALDGAHRVIRELRKRAGVSAEETADLWARLDDAADQPNTE